MHNEYNIFPQPGFDKRICFGKITCNAELQILYLVVDRRDPKVVRIEALDYK